MASWCLLPADANRFLDAIRSGALDPERLMAMSSAERRAAFAEHVGENNASEVNTQFESKLLLKDQKRGLVNWANKVAGLGEATRRDLLATINRLDKVLQPEDERAFLADLAARKLGVSVTAEEAREIFNLSQSAERARQALIDLGGGSYRDGWNKDPAAGIAYGRAVSELLQRVRSMKPGAAMLSWKTVEQVAGIPRSLMTFLHFSAPFVQNWGMMSTPQFWRGLRQMFEYFGSEGAYQNLEGYMIGHPDYEFAKDGKLAMTHLTDKLTEREEDIQSSLLEQANTWLSARIGAPNAVRASNRAFAGYLNYVRFNRFVDLLNAARNNGEDVRLGSSVLTDLADAVNDFSGRGKLPGGRAGEQAGPALNALFFAPRKLAATIQMFNPVRYLDPRISKTARLAAARQLVGSLAATGAALALAKAMGAQVSVDPRDQNFAKIQIGRTKIDMTGGNSTYLRLLGRLVTNQEITSRGHLETLGQDEGAFKVDDRGQLLAHFIQGKLAPVAGAIADSLFGSPTGEPFSITREVADKAMPIALHSLLSFFINDPGNTAAMMPALTSIFGVSLEAPLPPPMEHGRNPWGEPAGVYEQLGFRSPAWSADPVNQELDRIGYHPSFPLPRIRGQPLTDEQMENYIQVSGRLAHMRLQEVMGRPMWQALSAGRRYSLVKHVVESARRSAQNSIIVESLNGPNDIVRRAYEAKQAMLQ